MTIFGHFVPLKNFGPPNFIVPSSPASNFDENAFFRCSNGLLEAEISSDHYCTQNREEEEIFHLDLDVIVYFVFPSFCVFVFATIQQRLIQGRNTEIQPKNTRKMPQIP